MAPRKSPQTHDLYSKLSAHFPGVLFQLRLFPGGRYCFPFASHGIREMFEVEPEQVLEDASPSSPPCIRRTATTPPLPSGIPPAN